MHADTVMAAGDIEGLVLIPDAITHAHEASLLREIYRMPWRDDIKRRVQHYGWIYDYKRRGVDPSLHLGPLPPWITRIAERALRDNHLGAMADQAIVNEYLPGQGIAAHVDSAISFGPQVATLSLGGATTMVFRKSGEEARRELRLTRRSLLVLSGEARHACSHSIPARRSDVVDGERVARERRVSITLRTVRRESDR